MSILLAVLLDFLFGEPPGRLHPVVWMGAYLGRVGRFLPALPPLQGLWAGAAAWLGGAALVVGLATAAATALAGAPAWIELPGLALLLKPLFSLRLLLDEVAATEAALTQGLDAGRARLAQIVSRDTTALSAGEVRESALESLAENLSEFAGGAAVLVFALRPAGGGAVPVCQHRRRDVGLSGALGIRRQIRRPRR